MLTQAREFEPQVVKIKWPPAQHLLILKTILTSMASNIIDLNDNRIFHTSEWIGVNKIYPTDSKPFEDSKGQVPVLSIVPTKVPTRKTTICGIVYSVNKQ